SLAHARPEPCGDPGARQDPRQPEDERQVQEEERPIGLADQARRCPYSVYSSATNSIRGRLVASSAIRNAEASRPTRSSLTRAPSTPAASRTPALPSVTSGRRGISSQASRIASTVRKEN